MRRTYLTLVLLATLLSASTGQKRFLDHHIPAQQTVDADQFDMKHLFLDIEADNLSTSLIAHMALRVIVGTPENGEFKLELVDKLTVDEVRLNGTPASFSHTNEILTIPVGAFNEGEEVLIEVRYQGEPNPASDGIFSGINNANSTSWGNQVTWTLSEPFNAKVWWPSKQDLNDKLDGVEMHITTNANLKAGSNGLLKNIVNLSGDRIRYEWESNYPIAYYLVAFTIGEYVEYNNYAKPSALAGDSILIQNFVYNNPETLPAFRGDLDMVPEMVELFSSLFGLYPFHEEKYGHVMAPFSGGMEHQTMSSMGFFSFGLDAHELGHQWFGNYVTCGEWNDIWINEGFARFCEYIAAEKLLSVKNAREVIVDDMLSVTGTDTGSIYIPKNQQLTDNRIFNFRLSYQKGGLILNMLRNVINDDDVFFAAVRTYLATYANSSVTGEDFKEVMETETGEDLTDFFDQWYYGEGHPIFDITWTKVPGDSLHIEVKQQTTDNISLFTTPLEFRITFESGLTKIIFLHQDTNEQEYTIAANGKVRTLTFDPDNWLIKEVNSFYQLDENGNPILNIPDEEQYIIYPNPVQDLIYFTQDIEKLNFLDASGRSVLVVHPADPIKSFDLSDMKSGLYFLQLYLDGEWQVVKIIKE